MYFPDFPDIDFKEETQAEFDARMIKVKEKWAELDRQLPMSERIILINRSNTLKREIKEDLIEIPKLIDYLEILFPELEQELKDRLNTYYKNRVIKKKIIKASFSLKELFNKDLEKGKNAK